MKPKFNLLESILKLIKTLDTHPIGGALFIRLVQVCLTGLAVAVTVAEFRSGF